MARKRKASQKAGFLGQSLGRPLMFQSGPAFGLLVLLAGFDHLPWTAVSAEGNSPGKRWAGALPASCRCSLAIGSWYGRQQLRPDDFITSCLHSATGRRCGLINRRGQYGLRLPASAV